MILFEVEVEGIAAGEDGRMPVLVGFAKADFKRLDDKHGERQGAIVITPKGALEVWPLWRVKVLRALPALTVDIKEAGQIARIMLPGQMEG